MKQVKATTFIAGLLVAALIGAGLGVVTTSRAAQDGMRPVVSQVEAPILLTQAPQAGSFAKVAELVKPAVLNINTLSKGGGGPQGRTPFEEFFGEEFFRRFFGEAPERIPQRSLGSGVIVDPTGIALTNAHVVEKAT